MDSFYQRLLCVSCPILAAYLALTVFHGALFLTRNRWYYAVSAPEAAGLLSIDLTLLGGLYFLLKRVKAEKLSVFIEMSRNVLQIYFIQWCFVGFIDSCFCYLLELVFSYPTIYLIGIVLFVLSAWIAHQWRLRRDSRGIGPLGGKDTAKM